MAYLLIILFTNCLAQEWADPHDMNQRTVPKKVNSDEYVGSAVSKIPSKQLVCNCCQDADYIAFMYLKRIINVIISSTNLDSQDEKMFRGKYFFQMENHDYMFLKEFLTSEKVNVGKLRQLDNILTQAFHNSFSEDALNIMLSVNEKLLNFFNTRRTFILFSVCIGLYIFYHLLKSNFSFLYILKYFIFIMLIIDYGFRYHTLSEEAEEHNISLKSQKLKNPTWYEYYFVKDDKQCEKMTVTLLKVALLQLNDVIIMPLSSLGTGIGQFAKELWGQLPFPYNFLMFPLILVLLIIFLPAVMTIINGRTFKINIMHLFHLQFGTEENNIDRVTGPTLHKFLNAVEQSGGVSALKNSGRKVIHNKRKKCIEYPNNRNKGKNSNATD